MEKVDKDQTIDETKSKLKASREQLEAELEFQLQDIKKDAANIGKQILLVGGGLYLSWKLIKSLTKSKKKKEEKKERRYDRYESSKNKNKGPGFGKMLLHQIVTMAVVALTDEVKQALNKDRRVNDRKKNS